MYSLNYLSFKNYLLNMMGNEGEISDIEFIHYGFFSLIFND